MSNWLAITVEIDILRSPLGNLALGELLMRKKQCDTLAQHPPLTPR